MNERNIHIINTPKIVPKGWGYEIHIHNDENYCGKILHFNKGGEFSMHYHVKKRETFYVAKGKLILKTINADTANVNEQEVNEGSVIEIYRGLTHQLKAIEESEIFEISTYDDINDSYRVWKGDSQK